MKTVFKTEEERSKLFTSIMEDASMTQQLSGLKLMGYVTYLEDTVRHLEFMEGTKDTIIESYKGMLQRNVIID